MKRADLYPDDLGNKLLVSSTMNGVVNPFLTPFSHFGNTEDFNSCQHCQNGLQFQGDNFKLCQCENGCTDSCSCNSISQSSADHSTLYGIQTRSLLDSNPDTLHTKEYIIGTNKPHRWEQETDINFAPNFDDLPDADFFHSKSFTRRLTSEPNLDEKVIEYLGGRPDQIPLLTDHTWKSSRYYDDYSDSNLHYASEDLNLESGNVNHSDTVNLLYRSRDFSNSNYGELLPKLVHRLPPENSSSRSQMNIMKPTSFLKLVSALYPDNLIFPQLGSRTFLFAGKAKAGGINWDNINEFQNDFFYGRGAFIGRAVASTTAVEGSRCTGWHYHGSNSAKHSVAHLLTAAHCRGPSPIRYPSIDFLQCPSSRKRPFANLLEATYGFFPRANEFIENKLRAFGLPEVLIRFLEKEGLDPIAPERTGFERLREQRCQIATSFYNSADGCSDIDIYNCIKSILPGYSINFVPENNVRMSSSDIFGSVRLAGLTDRFHRQYNREVYSLSMNDKLDISSLPLENLLSPKGLVKLYSTRGVWDGRDRETIDSSFMTYGNWIKPRSSGGPVLDLRTNTGLGAFSWWIPDIGPVFPRNYHFMIPPPRLHKSFSGIQGFIDLSIPYMLGSNLSSDLMFTRRIGGAGGNLSRLSCPPEMAATGIVASEVRNRSNSDKTIGNLGLICMPFSDNFRFDLAKVISGGSADTNQAPTFGQGFDHYITTNLTNDRPFVDFSFFGIPFRFFTAGKQQDFFMCPPRYYLSGIWALPGTNPEFASGVPLVKSIRGIECKRYDLRATITNGLMRFLGGRGNFSLPATCPPNFVADGIDISSGLFTDSFKLRCRKLIKR